MILIMVVSIYTSRVILDKLGVDDYGLYNAVASIVAMVSFLNATLSTSTSRFLTYDLGQGDAEKLRNTFSVSFYSHLMLAVVVVLLLETAGLWYMGHKFVVPAGREVAVNIVYQISVFTTAIAIVQVPYTASIMAHENMDVYAYLGIAEVFLKLGVVYLLSVASFDKLVLYSILIAFIQISLTLSYYIICRNKYSETRLRRYFSRSTFKGMMSFTGWTAVANLSNTVIVQGATVLLNLFFAPAIIASKALANQITNAIMQFVNNFRVALNPQIIKSYSSGEFEEFKKWSLRSTVVSCDLMIVLGLPCVASMKTILNLWLVEVPPLAVEFTQIVIISQILASISSSTYISFVAAGKVKLNALWGTAIGFGYFILLYFCFKLGAGALWVQWLYLITMLIGVFWQRPYLMHKEIGFSYKEIFKCVLECLKPFLTAGLITLGLMSLFGDRLWEQAMLFISVFVVSCASVWLFLEKGMRLFVLNLIKSRFHSSS